MWINTYEDLFEVGYDVLFFSSCVVLVCFVHVCAALVGPFPSEGWLTLRMVQRILRLIILGSGFRWVLESIGSIFPTFQF